MKLSIFSLALLLSTGLVSATPTPGGKSKSLPKSPSKSLGSLSQSCSASQSSIRCCNQTKNGKSSHKVSYDGQSFDAQCDQINGDSGKNVQSICEATVACCQGDGCVAIAY